MCIKQAFSMRYGLCFKFKDRKFAYFIVTYMIKKIKDD